MGEYRTQGPHWHLPDLNRTEMAAMLPLAVAIIVAGVLPFLLTDIFGPAVDAMYTHIHTQAAFYLNIVKP
jgi:NADH:ubiquinone oxidoreductase subunit 4 (subunit M)